MRRPLGETKNPSCVGLKDQSISQTDVDDETGVEGVVEDSDTEHEVVGSGEVGDEYEDE